MEIDLLWRDPDISIKTFGKSYHSVCFVFGQKALDKIINVLNFDKIICGHQTVINGFLRSFGIKGRIYTFIGS